MNCFAERFVPVAHPSNRRILIFEERYLRTDLTAPLPLSRDGAGYNGRRPHRALRFVRHAPIVPLRILTTGGSDADRNWKA